MVMSLPPLQTYASPPLDDSEPADSEPVPGPGVEGGHGERFGLHCPRVLQYALVCEVGLWPCGVCLCKRPDDVLSEVNSSSRPRVTMSNKPVDPPMEHSSPHVLPAHGLACDPGVG